MRILFFIDSMRAGGKERRLTELMKVLQYEKEIKFELAIMDKDVHYNEALNLGINIHYLIRNTKKDLQIFNAFYRLCKEFRPDIVHCWDSMTVLYSIPACKLLKIKLINGMIVDAPAKLNIFKKSKFRAKIAFPFSDIIIGNSNAGIKVYNAPRSKSICVYNGYNFERSDNLLNTKELRDQLSIETPFVIGMVATFGKNKDYKTYFEAAQQILKKRADITFIAIGEGTDSIESKALISAELLQNFRLLGKRLNTESYINMMDICVLTTYTEGISNSILEYMALAKPVIATDGGGTSEIINDRKTGFLIAPSNPADLIEKTELLINKPEIRLNMGQDGKARIQNYFSIGKMVSHYVSIYNSLYQ
jgi:glycosyltransferase involved in cell wall biosynthesis